MEPDDRTQLKSRIATSPPFRTPQGIRAPRRPRPAKAKGSRG